MLPDSGSSRHGDLPGLLTQREKKGLVCGRGGLQFRKYLTDLCEPVTKIGAMFAKFGTRLAKFGTGFRHLTVDFRIKCRAVTLDLGVKFRNVALDLDPECVHDRGELIRNVWKST